MKFNHTNTMRDDNKPTAPEGYTVIWGNDVPGVVPPASMVWDDSLAPTGWSLSDNVGSVAASYSWYAVPNAKAADDKPTAPEGYYLTQGADVPYPTPAGTRLWAGDRWDVLSGEKLCPSSFCQWYAVPNAKAVDDKPTTPPEDPKASQAIQKPQLQLIPPSLNNEAAKALSRGAVKYGPWNWRENKVELMTYLGAMKRHIDCLIEGEDVDPDTGAHHLGCVAAGCGIVLDARKHGTLVDNRPRKAQNT
jgi:hypothetical protein